MPHSTFKGSFIQSETCGTLKCSCGRTFRVASERDRKMKIRLHNKACSIKVERSEFLGSIEHPKKKVTMKEYEIIKAKLNEELNKKFS